MGTYDSPESKVIGCALMDIQSIYGVYNTLHPYMFKNQVLGEIYRVLLSLYDSHSDSNLEVICQELESDILDRETIGMYLQRALSYTVTSSHISSYAKIVADDYKARQVSEMFSKADLLSGHINQTIGELIQKLESLRSNDASGIKKMVDVVDSNKGNYYKPKENTNKKIRFGLDSLDDALNGVEAGNVCVVGARPSVGKSALVTQLIDVVASDGNRVGYFNLEMPEKEIYERFVARKSGINLGRIINAESFNDYDEKSKFDDANDILSAQNVYIDDKARSVGDIKRICRHLDLDLVVIDYLQLIKLDRRIAGGRTQEVGEISRSIKQMAMELKVPVVLLSQLNRNSEHTDTKEPSMSELREAGDIEQDASQIILMWLNDRENINSRGIKIAKNRQGKKFSGTIFFDGATMNFYEKKEDKDGFIQEDNCPFD